MQSKGFRPPKSTKKCSFAYNRYNVYLTKAKNRTLSLLLKHSNTYSVENLGHIQNKSIIYRPSIYNLLTGTVSFPDQEQLLEKVECC